MQMCAVFAWLLLWQLAATAVSLPLLLPSPVSVAARLGQLCITMDFWGTVVGSLWHVLQGFLLGMLLGTVLAWLGWRWAFAQAMIRPMIGVLKATPVASFIILALVWIETQRLATVISFIMVLPLVYYNMSAGINAADRKLLEMAQVFGLSRRKVFRYCYLPAIWPFFSIPRARSPFRTEPSSTAPRCPARRHAGDHRTERVDTVVSGTAHGRLPGELRGYGADAGRALRPAGRPELFLGGR